MGEASAVEIDTWLRDGGIVVTASERAARSLALAFHRARRAEGLTAWPTPKIQDWQSFARAAWDERADERSLDGRVVLSPLQEQSLWARIVAHAAPEAVQLAGAGDRLAALAMDAHHLLCDYAPQLLKDNARIGWDQDAGAFSGWLTAFNELCRDSKLLSAARLPLELSATLEADTARRFCLPASTVSCPRSKHCLLRGVLTTVCTKLGWARRRNKWNFTLRPILPANSPPARFGRRPGSRPSLTHACS